MVMSPIVFMLTLFTFASAALNDSKPISRLGSARAEKYGDKRVANMWATILRPLEHIYLVVSIKTKHVLALKSGSLYPGAQVVMERRRPEFVLDQLWYQDTSGALVSVSSSYAISTETQGEHPTPTTPPEIVGCYTDQTDRDLWDAQVDADNNTQLTCRDHCHEKGFTFAGTQNGRSCFCGNTYGRYGPSAECKTPCAGDHGHMCGGTMANLVMKTGLHGVVVVPEALNDWEFFGNHICNGDQMTKCLETYDYCNGIVSTGDYEPNKREQQWVLEQVN